MSDPENILIKQSENVQSAKQLRFTSLDEIINLKSVITSYLKNAIEVEKSGVKVEMKKTTEYNIPEEFQLALSEMTDLKTAFDKLTPGRQRAYLLYFSSAKQAKTRNDRIEKYISKILNGKGLDD